MFGTAWLLLLSSLGMNSSCQISEFSKIEKTILDSKSPSELRTTIRRYINPKLSESELSGFRNSPFHSLAIHAEWQQLLNSIQGSKEPSELQVDRFLGWFEGRFRIDIPEHWKQSFSQADFRSDKTVSFLQQPRVEIEPTDDWLFYRKGKQISADKKSIFDKANGITIRLPKVIQDLLNEENSDTTVVESTLVDQKRSVLRIHSTDLSEYRIFCIDSDSGKIAWESTVLAGEWFGGGSGGANDHWTDVVLSDGRVFVFGVESLGVYVECFDFTNGQPLWRFNSTVNTILNYSKAQKRD